jgi:signal transduction histidine kinase
MTDNFCVEVGGGMDVERLRAARRRLVVAADADRCRIERELHQGVQQHLVALAVKLQLAGDLAGAGLLEELRDDVQRALDETTRLAARIRPPLPPEGGLGAALRATATLAGVAATVDVGVGADVAPEVATTIYLCWLDALDRGERPAITVRDGDGAITCEIRGAAATEPDGLRDRVEALGGTLTLRGTRLSLSLP